MAMVTQQVENFVQKFRELWASGLSAHLDLDCEGGEAWVGLRLRLGRHRVGGAQHGDRDGRHRRGASYARRLERRAAARTAAAQATSVTPGQAEQASQAPAPAVGASAPETEEEVDASAEIATEETEQVTISPMDADDTAASLDDDIAEIEMSKIVSCPSILRGDVQQRPVQPVGLDGEWWWCPLDVNLWAWDCRTCGWKGLGKAKQEGCPHPYD